MKFEPLVFLRIAQRNGLKLTRLGNDINLRHPADLDEVWKTAIIKHKRRLLRHLPDHEFNSLQVDLFEDL